MPVLASRTSRRPLAVAVLHAEDGRVEWVPPTDPRDCAQAQVLVVAGERPLALLRAQVRAGGLVPPEGGWPAAASGPPLPRTGPLLTVVVTTCDEPDLVRQALGHLAAQSYRDLEVVVVENRPARSRVAGALAASPVPARYVEEPVPGLSRARNAGLAAARGEHVAFLDDDVRPGSSWAAAAVQALADVPDAACVTGQILPSDLHTTAQQLLEAYGGYTKGFQRQVFRGATDPQDPLYPFAPGRFGSGANSTWRREALRALGGWHEQLGAGTPSRGGEDLEAFTRVLLRGGTLVYEPSAVVWHPHRPDLSALRRQMLAYGQGLGAVVGAWLATPETRREVLRRLPAGVRHALAPGSDKNRNRSEDYPLELVARELLGVALGPVGYARARRAARRTTGG